MSKCKIWRTVYVHSLSSKNQTYVGDAKIVENQSMCVQDEFFYDNPHPFCSPNIKFPSHIGDTVSSQGWKPQFHPGPG